MSKRAARVWQMFQARCSCGWAGEIWGLADRGNAADEAREHRKVCSGEA